MADKQNTIPEQTTLQIVQGLTPKEPSLLGRAASAAGEAVTTPFRGAAGVLGQAPQIAGKFGAFSLRGLSKLAEVQGFTQIEGGLDKFADALQQETMEISDSISKKVGLSPFGQKTTEFIGEMAVPVARAPKILGAIGKGKAARGAFEGALGTQLGSIASTSEAATPGETAVGAALGGALGSVLPAGKLAAETTTAALGKTTGAGQEAIKEAFRQAGNEEFVNALRGKVDETELLNSVKSGIQKVRDTRNLVYGSSYEKLKNNNTDLNIDALKTDFINKISSPEGANIKIGQGGDLDFSESVIADAEGQKIISSIYKDLVSWNNNTPVGLDTLKRRLDSYYAKDNRFVQSLNTNIKTKLKSLIVDEVPEYADMVKGYERITSELEDIMKTLSVGDKNAKMTSITRLNQVLKDNLAFRLEMLESLEKLSGKNLKGKLTGFSLQETLPKGLAGVLFTFGAPVAFLTEPKYLAAIGATSPRLVGEMANILGVSAKKLKGALDAVKNKAEKGFDFFPRKFDETMNNLFGDKIKKNNIDKGLGAAVKGPLTKAAEEKSLINEAKKYKNAEEFVQSKSNVYHSGVDLDKIDKINPKKSKFGDVFFVSDDKTHSSGFGGPNAKLNNLFLNENANLVDFRNIGEKQIKEIEDYIIKYEDTGHPIFKDGKMVKNKKSINIYPWTKKQISSALRSKGKEAPILEDPNLQKVYKALGYDGMVTIEGGSNNFGIFNTDVLKTKKQLIDIYNKAKKQK